MDRNIDVLYHSSPFNTVALRKESVDRNPVKILYKGYTTTVALRKESVDRNKVGNATPGGWCGRSPQGERG